MSSATTAASCNNDCCELDNTKCGNYYSSISCATGKYKDATVIGTETAAGGANKNTDCCIAKATCSAGTCSAGYKKKSTLANLYCTSSATTAASCNANCCDIDNTKCLNYGSTISCASAATYWDAAASAGTAAGAAGVDKNTACCTARALCSAYATCSAGWIKSQAYCSSSATTTAACNSGCCQLDETKCAKYASSLACATGKYYDNTASAAMATALGGANKNTDCCTTKAACSTGTCSTGYRKKITLTNLVCTSSATTAASCNTNCCDLDTTKCLAHSSTISCAAGKYFDAAASAGVATTTADKNTACCIDKAACSAGTCSAGYKKKSTLTNLHCTSSATTAASCNTDCCELDDTKCGNYYSSVSCATGKYKDACRWHSDCSRRSEQEHRLLHCKGDMLRRHLCRRLQEEEHVDELVLHFIRHDCSFMQQ